MLLNFLYIIYIYIYIDFPILALFCPHDAEADKDSSGKVFAQFTCSIYLAYAMTCRAMIKPGSLTDMVGSSTTQTPSAHC